MKIKCLTVLTIMPWVVNKKLSKRVFHPNEAHKIAVSSQIDNSVLLRTSKKRIPVSNIQMTEIESFFLN